MKALLLNQFNAKTHLQNWKVGALFMEAGTGKTRVAIELINSIPDIDLVIWIAPLRTIKTMPNITSVIEEVSKWGGFNAKSSYYGVESIGGSDRIYLEVRQKIIEAKNPFVVVDESLKIKNAEAKRTQRLLSISELAQYKLILNGTPLSRNLLDLWSQMEFLSPKILHMNLCSFKNTFCNYTKITKRIGRKSYAKEFITGYENIDYLYSLIRHYIFECDLSLNISQCYSECLYKIGDSEMEEYQRLKGKYLNDETLQWKNNSIFLEMTQKMQHSYCITEDKFKVLNNIFKNISQAQTIIFCKYIISQAECAKRYPNATVLSYQKDALGLNLQNFNYTIYFDKIWDLALRVQSSRRTFRTGQEQDCRYYDLTGNVGLERLIDNNIKNKVSMTEYFKKKAKNEIAEEL